MIYEPYEDSTAKRVSIVVLVATVLLIVALLLCGCASTKPCPPCPPAEVVIVKVPVSSCLPPPEITPPVLWMVTLSASGATIQEILTAAEHDRAELLRALAECETALEVYGAPAPNPISD